MSSEIPLAAPPSTETDGAAVDVTFVRGGEITPPFQRPSEQVIAELIVEGFPWYTFCRMDEGYVCRVVGVADFVIDPDLKRVVCHPVTGGRTGMIPIIIQGTITAFLLTMGGRYVLHGSAVDLGGRALAFVGPSGQGKSTMAAIFCASGAQLVTDDILPLEFDSDAEGAESVYCLRSGHEIRLRQKAASLAENFGAEAVRITVDERHAVAPETSSLRRLPLSVIVLPRPDRQRHEVVATRLTPGDASLALGRSARIEGWRERAHLRQQFVDVGRIVNGVPVLEVSVPWGPPFENDLAQRVVDACAREGASTGQRATR